MLRLALPDGRLLDDGEALAYILQRLPGLRMIGNVARLPGGRRVMRSLYWTVASNRGRLADFVRYRPLIVRRPEGEGAEGPQKQEGPQQ